MSFAQGTDLRKMSEKARNRYLVKIAKEVVMNFGPDYYRTYKKPIVLDPITFDEEHFKWVDAEVLQKYVGRKYYRVVFEYDMYKEMLMEDYAAIIYIWEDDGTPARVLFGGVDFGIQFLYISYEQRLKEGISKDMIIPYVQSQKLKPGTQSRINRKRSWER